MLGESQIRQFYLQGFKETAKLENWSSIWRKQFRIRTRLGYFLKLNRFRPRLNLKHLLGFCIRYAPMNLYMSTLNWLMPERVGRKRTANRAYPLNGEYVADIDVPSIWRPNTGMRKIGSSDLQLAYDKTRSLIDKIQENYSDLHMVFSGRRGFHVHVLDFKVNDWAKYDERTPIRSHEVSRFHYTRYLKSALGEFSKYHFTLSTDPMRVMTVPGSLNGKTGKICFYVGDSSDFEKLTFEDVVRRSDASRYLYNNGFQSANSFLHSHPETLRGR
jgi:DNA primase catalytic subunit